MNAPASPELPERRDERQSSAESVKAEELMRRVCESDDAGAFAEIVRRYSGELARYLRHYLHSVDAADDVLQTVLLHAYRHRDQYEVGRRLRPWLYSIATHAAIDWLRAQSHHHEQSLDSYSSHEGNAEDVEKRLLNLLAADESAPATNASLKERRSRLRRAIRELPERLRSVVVLVSLLGMKHRDAAETLDVPVGTIKSRTHEALRRLREAFAKENELE